VTLRAAVGQRDTRINLPELRSSPELLSPDRAVDLLGAGPRLAVVFAAEAELFQSTVHQLQLDADAAARDRDVTRVSALGVHTDWRSPDCWHATSALLVDFDGLVSQRAFERPMRVDVAWTLHLPLDGEKELHAAISRDCERSGLLQVNPYRASERADDKLCSHRLWMRCLSEGSDTFALPAATTIPRDASADEAIADIESFAQRLDLPATIIAQPNSGTEGQQIAAARVSESDLGALDERHSLVRHLCDVVLPTDDALVREERGNIRLSDLRRVAFRINVAWSGSEFVAESGFAQVAPDPEAVVVSRGREGAIADLSECLADLHCQVDDSWRRFVPSDDDIATLRHAAEAAAGSLNVDLEEDDYLKHMGIDMVLEVDPDSGKLTPVLLEANARPAGLNQSTALRGISPEPSRLHVTTALFDYIADCTAS